MRSITLFCGKSVSRFFHNKGRPSGVTLPEITAEVQAESGPALPKDTMAAIKANKVRFIAKKFYR